MQVFLFLNTALADSTLQTIVFTISRIQRVNESIFTRINSPNYLYRQARNHDPLRSEKIFLFCLFLFVFNGFKRYKKTANLVGTC